MKFLSLDLLAYGPFTKRSLSFPKEGPNLHLIYGPNEAGKSTTLRAISGLLYGIEKNTGDAHAHAMAELRIAARLLHSSGEERSFVRKKGNQGTLLDEHGGAVDETLLSSWLSVSERKQFVLMFGLDHEQLRAAGEALTNPKTSLGETLFGAALNGTALQQTLLRLEGEAEKLLSPAGNAGAIPKALTAYRERRTRAGEKMLPAKEWQERLDALADAEAKRAAVIARTNATQAERHRIERHQRALPLMRQYVEARRERAALGDVRLLPRDVADLRKEVLRALETADLAHKRAAADLEQAQHERGALAVPELLATASVRIKELTVGLGQYEKERVDIPGLKKELGGLRNRQREILQALELPELAAAFEPSDLDRIRVPASVEQRIQALEKSEIQLRTVLTQLRDQHSATSAKASRRREELAALPPARDVAVLQSTWGILQPDRKLETSARAAEALASEASLRAAQALKALGLWTGSIEQVTSLPVPPEETIRRFEREFEAHRAERKRLERLRSEKLASLEACRRDTRALLDDGTVPSEEGLAKARELRDEGWTRVLAAWRAGADASATDASYSPNGPLPEAFEAAQRAADDLADRLRREAGRAATLAGLVRTEAALGAELAALETASGEATSRAEACAEQWSNLWLDCGFAPETPEEMARWRRRYDSLVEAIRQCDEADAAGRRSWQTLRTHREAIESALTLAGAPAPLESPWLTLLLHSEHTLASAAADVTRASALRGECSSLQAELSTLDAQIENRVSALGEWSREWAEAMTHLRLPPRALPAEAATVKTKLDELFREETKRVAQEKRLNAIEKQQRAFEERLDALVRDLGVELAGTKSEIANELIARHTTAVKEAERGRALEREVDRCRRALAEAEIHRATAQKKLDSLLADAGCSTLAELDAGEERSARARDCDDRSTAAEHRLIELGEGHSPEFLEQELSETTSDALESKLAELAEELSQCEEEKHAAGEEVGARREKVRSGSGSGEAAALAGEAQEHLALARSHADRYARLRLAAAVLRRGVERYRKLNEGAILQRASRLFERLTHGRYEQLRIAYEDGKAKLRCVRNGRLVAVEDALSDGTLDQLFLSLRLASIEQHLAAQEPMPLVLDDIFIHFDDDRASAGIEVLAEVAEKTQVLLLTHHARNLELARRALPPERWTEHRL